VGMAIAEVALGARFNRPRHQIVDHYTYVLESDGDLIEPTIWSTLHCAEKVGRPAVASESESRRLRLRHLEAKDLRVSYGRGGANFYTHARASASLRGQCVLRRTHAWITSLVDLCLLIWPD
jgi:hypothetical protein